MLFDRNLPRRFRTFLRPHNIKTTRDTEWKSLSNGVLIQSAAMSGFDVFLTIDKKIRHEQNLNKLPLPIIVLDCISNALPQLLPFAPHVLELLQKSLLKRLYIIQPDGQIVEMGVITPP